MFRSYEEIFRTPVKQEASNSALYKCEFCDQPGWNTECQVQIHKRYQHQEDIEKLLKVGRQLCATCMKTYDTKKQLYEHFLKIHLLCSEKALRVEREMFVCNECENVFFKKEFLVIHQVFSHKLLTSTKELVVCPKCLKNVPLKKFKIHFSYHLKKSLIVCPFCLYNCKGWKEYYTHVDSHPKYLSCDVCDSQLANVDGFREHALKHQKEISHGPYPKDMVITASNYFVPKNPKPWMHKNIHPINGLKLQGVMRICVLCREICISKNAMTQHYQWHIKQPIIAEIDKKKFRCECGEEFSYKILLKQHKTKCTVLPNSDCEVIPIQIQTLEKKNKKSKLKTGSKAELDNSTSSKAELDNTTVKNDLNFKIDNHTNMMEDSTNTSTCSKNERTKIEIIEDIIMKPANEENKPSDEDDKQEVYIVIEEVEEDEDMEGEG